jgi:hypothetical protein
MSVDHQVLTERIHESCNLQRLFKADSCLCFNLGRIMISVRLIDDECPMHLAQLQ